MDILHIHLLAAFPNSNDLFNLFIFCAFVFGDSTNAFDNKN